MPTSGIVERLRDRGTTELDFEAAAEIERLRKNEVVQRDGCLAVIAAGESQQNEIERLLEVRENEGNEIERLRAALEPFQRNVEALSLSAALGHITREHLWDARRALEPKS